MDQLFAREPTEPLQESTLFPAAPEDETTQFFKKAVLTDLWNLRRHIGSHDKFARELRSLIDEALQSSGVQSVFEKYR